jgi:sugar transferase EpsL
VKRVVDVAGAVAGLVVLSPVLLVVAVAALVTQGRPILFRQMRPGLHGRPFTIVKFRTMRPPRPEEMSLEGDALRLTRLGAFLRSSSLDELPELWNVLKGEMSLVGPRPLMMDFLDRYTPEEARRHDVRPGVTGWAIVQGRHAVRFEDRLRMDVWYVDHWSPLLDLRIIGSTIKQVLRREGVSTIQTGEGMGLPERFRVQPSEERWLATHPQAGRDQRTGPPG